MGRVEYRVICMTIWMSMIVIGGAEPVVVVLKGGEEVCGLYNPMFAALPASSGKGRASQYVKMTISEPLNACEKLVGDGFSGSAVLVERGSCSFAEKAQHVERAGGSLVVVENTEDSFITPVANASLGEYDEVNIPVIVVNHSGGLVLRTGDDVRLNAYEIVEPAWLAVGEEFASVVAGLIGVLVVVCGSILATKPKDRTPARPSSSVKKGTNPEKGDAEAIIILDRPVTIFLVMSVQLLLLYLLYDYVVHIVIISFAIGAGGSLVFILRQFTKPDAPDVLVIPRLGVKATAADIVLTALAITLSVLWYSFRHSSWSWILQNILGIFLMLFVMQTLKLPSIKVGVILLSCLFLYDIFFVFVTPLFTSTGESVMERVARGGPTSSEHLPMMIVVPYLFSPPSVSSSALFVIRSEKVLYLNSC
uniref:PA domain-containing protein n=1 Tax=Rhodosorus marinus TaxID=101924 RepID=A0A7S2ZJ18_9RHOD